MPIDHAALDLERAGWRALSSSGEEARAFYDRVLGSEVCFVLPGGLVIHDRGDALESMAGAPWDDFELADERVVTVNDDAVAVTYRVDARRGEQRYGANITTTYARDQDHWRLVVHQQTPV